MIRRFSGERGSASTSTIVAVFAAGALVGALAAVEVVPADRVPTANAGGPGVVGDVVAGGSQAPGVPGATTGPGTTTGGNAGGNTGGNTGSTGGNTGGNTGGTVVPPSKFECRAGANGGATDRGVTATSINMATTIVASGLGSSFLGEMRYGMQAVVERVNRAGGICGRKLHFDIKDDGWDIAKGSQYLRNYINDRSKFGIPVGASSEGLQAVIKSGDIDRAQFPVVGGDGLAIDQYSRPDGSAQPWVWPIATATVSSARIMANDAYNRGARNMAIVFDRQYHFGKEAAAAFNAEVKRLTGKDVNGYNKDNNCDKAFCGIDAGKNSYSQFTPKVAGANPDFIALFLEPDTALTWMQDPNTPAASDSKIKYGYGAAQPLFTLQFETACKQKCDQMVVWSGFKPNVDRYKSDPAMVEYVRALKSIYRQADPYNQFTESAYVGMQMLVEALKKVGPELTRTRLKAVLDTMTYKDPLTIQGTMTFTPNSRFANVTMQAFTMQYKGAPGLWRLGTILKDPRPGGVH